MRRPKYSVLLALTKPDWLQPTHPSGRVKTRPSSCLSPHEAHYTRMSCRTSNIAKTVLKKNTKRRICFRQWFQRKNSHVKKDSYPGLCLIEVFPHSKNCLSLEHKSSVREINGQSGSTMRWWMSAPSLHTQLQGQVTSNKQCPYPRLYLFMQLHGILQSLLFYISLNPLAVIIWFYFWASCCFLQYLELVPAAQLDTWPLICQWLTSGDPTPWPRFCFSAKNPVFRSSPWPTFRIGSLFAWGNLFRCFLHTLIPTQL